MNRRKLQRAVRLLHEVLAELDQKPSTAGGVGPAADEVADRGEGHASPRRLHVKRRPRPHTALIAEAAQAKLVDKEGKK